MAEFFLMPQASPTMEAGVILAWHKPEGAHLEPQDVIAEVETDKAAMEIEVFDSGVLLKILAEEGAEVPAGQPIAIIGTAADEDISALVAAFAAQQASPSAPAPAAAAAAPAPAPAAAPAAPAAAAPTARAGLTGFQWQGSPVDENIMEMPEAFVFELDPATGKVRAAPAARKAARERGIDLAQVAGTGPRGRVLRSDVERFGTGPVVAAPAAPASETVRNSQMRKTIARRLKAVWQDAPVFYLTSELNCDAMVAFRSQIKAAGVKVSYNDFVIKACARALKDVPAVNASWGEDAITRHGSVHIGVAVALPDGLITPVIRDADQKGLATIGGEMRELAGKARERKLTAEEYTGSTFSVSNLGMMGIEEFTAILNPPEACILAVGEMKRQPVFDADGAVVASHRMRVTLTCDHRVVDGALGAEFLQAVRRYIESPALLAT